MCGVGGHADAVIAAPLSVSTTNPGEVRIAAIDELRVDGAGAKAAIPALTAAAARWPGSGAGGCPSRSQTDTKSVIEPPTPPKDSPEWPAPVPAMPTTTEKSKSTAPAWQVVRPIRILIIDDEEAVCRVIESAQADKIFTWIRSRDPQLIEKRLSDNAGHEYDLVLTRSHFANRCSRTRSSPGFANTSPRPASS